jgi:hypothetical protein
MRLLDEHGLCLIGPEAFVDRAHAMVDPAAACLGTAYRVGGRSIQTAAGTSVMGLIAWWIGARYRTEVR